MKTSQASQYSEGLGPKKTMFVMVTVVGCIAILWPKVFYPMMFGSSPPTQPYKDFRPGGTGLRQERPPHLRPEGVHPAMRERGRAIPNTQTVPIVDRARNSRDSPVRIVEGRPGPIPGMRPPMGAGSVHQAQPKGSSMGIIMPLYTIGIIAFFCYTIMKVGLMFKKPQPNEPYGAVPQNSTFKKEVYGDNAGKYKGESPTIGSNNHHTYNNDISGQKHEETCINHKSDFANPLFCSTKQNGVQAIKSISQFTSNATTAIASATTTTTVVSAITNGSLSNHTDASSQSSKLIVCNNNNNNNNSKSSNSNGHIVTRKNSKNKDQLMEIEWLRKKLEETEKAMAKLIAEMNNTQIQRKDTSETSNQNGNISNGHAKHHKSDEESSKVEELSKDDDPSAKLIESEKQSSSEKKPSERKKRDTVTVMGMELTASFEGGHKWNRPVTPEFPHHEHSSRSFLNGHQETKSIYLEGSLPHESQILVAESETTTEKVTDLDYDDDEDEPAVVLSSKISLSLINMGSGEDAESDDFEKNAEIDVALDDADQNEENDEIEDKHFEEEQVSDNNRDLSDEN